MYTKGEWKWRWEGQPTIRKKDGLDLIATVYPKIGKRLFAPVDEAEANAHLIAKSPEMAELLKRMVESGWSTAIAMEAKEIIQTLDLEAESK